MATVVHRISKQILRSVNTPDFPSDTWLINPPGLAALESAGTPSRHWKVVGDDLEEEDATGKAVADAVILNQYKQQKCELIDMTTAARAAAGAVYSGKTFSLSERAQTRLLGDYMIRTDMTYPLRCNTIDNLDALNITDAADMAAFYDAISATVRDHVDRGTALKDRVRAALTLAEVDAVVDLR